MADGRRHVANSQLDLEELLLEAQNRWLRPNEVCEVLHNYKEFTLSAEPPYKPTGGSFFLFDRKTLRYFRNDGHKWMKKKDGKKVREAREKLKVLPSLAQEHPIGYCVILPFRLILSCEELVNRSCKERFPLVDSVDVLQCYYAHGEENENFHRRSYWMLDGELKHIVFVHYREVTEGRRAGVSRAPVADTGTQNLFVGHVNASHISSDQVDPAVLTRQTSFVTSPSPADLSEEMNSPECEDGDVEDVGASLLSKNMSYSRLQIDSLPSIDGISKDISKSTGIITKSLLTGEDGELPSNFGINQLLIENTIANADDPPTCSSPQHVVMTEFSVTETAGHPFGWLESQNLGMNQDNMHNHKTLFKHTIGCMSGSALNFHQRLQKSNHDPAVKEQRMQEQVDQGSATASHSMAMERQNFTDIGSVDQDLFHYDKYKTSKYEINDETCVASSSYLQARTIKSDHGNSSKDVLDVRRFKDDDLDSKKLDSFERWMNKEIGADCNDTLMASDTGNYWHTLDAECGEREVSSLAAHMQLDIDLLCPSLSQEQLFSIVDFSPEWAYAGIDIKVIISGIFLSGATNPKNFKWGCMFGELEVSAEMSGNNVLCCQAPIHSPGRVPFYVTCSNRLACSEVREFNYRENPQLLLPAIVKCDPQNETALQVRLAKILTLGTEKKRRVCPIEDCQKCGLKKSILSLRGDDKTEWNLIEKSVKDVHGNARELLMQKLLKDRLYHWLLCKTHEQGKGLNMLDDNGQGAIHLAAALGYEWAMGPIVSAGVSPNFRDVRGRTALHWAASFGREETVVTLLHLDAAPGALEDPTVEFPGGRTAADLASSTGHKGIAGYLAEADLITHHSSISLSKVITDSVSTTVAVETSIESVNKQGLPYTLDGEAEVSLKKSLAAVRKSAQAAAEIQAAFRVHSFKQRRYRDTCTSGVDSPHHIQSLVNAKMSLKKSHTSIDEIAAIKIQRKYRGWRAHKDFVKIRDCVVKIQAHVRRHQVRQQYKKVVWSVGIVEKAILRWRRRGTGLRGFRADRSNENVGSAGEENDEYDFLRLGRKKKVAGIERALARVQSMVGCPEAREQYSRLLSNFQKLKMADEEAGAGEDPMET